MGLSLCYELRASVGPEEARRLIEELHGHAVSLPFDEVLNIVEWREPDSAAADDAADDADDDFIRAIGAQYGKKRLPGGEETWVTIPPRHVIFFGIVPAEGSETAQIGLAAHRPVVEWRHEGHVELLETGLAGVYSWSQCCKTQYAGLAQHGGFDNFLRAHESLVKLLDRVRDVGIELQVSDDSGYWADRDPERLRRELDSWNGLIAAFAGQLKDRLGRGGDQGIEAPILDAPDFEHLEAKGLAEWSPPPAEEDDRPRGEVH